jgi:hypothetical protein
MFPPMFPISDIANSFEVNAANMFVTPLYT